MMRRHPALLTESERRAEVGAILAMGHARLVRKRQQARIVLAPSVDSEAS